MLTRHLPVYLSFVSIDLPIATGLETVATLYQKDQERFHLVLTEPPGSDRPFSPFEPPTPSTAPRLLWLELSPYRTSMTLQSNGQFSYRHLWEQGVYGLSHYWLYNTLTEPPGHLRLRNFTRSLLLQGGSLPSFFRVEYELWSGMLRLGHYVLNLEIRH